MIDVARRSPSRRMRIPLLQRGGVRTALAGVVLTALGIGGYLVPDLLLLATRHVTSDSPPGQWAMFRRDLGNSGATGTDTSVPRGAVKWVFATGGAVHSSPAVVDGTVYVGSRDARLYALDAATGAKRWEFRTESWVESSPAVVDGSVYFGSQDGKLRALDAATGALRWEFDAGFGVWSSPAVAGGLVYFGASDTLYAVDAASGKRRWSFEIRGRAGSPVVANGIVYVGSVYALDARRGWRRLRFRTFQRVGSTVAVAGGTVYAVNSDGIVIAIDGSARNAPLEHRLKPYTIQLYAMGLWPRPKPQSGSLWALSLGQGARTSPVVADGVLYVAAEQSLVAVDLATRELRWAFPAGDAFRSSPALLGDTLYVGNNDGAIYAVGIGAGAERWRVRTGGMVTGSPAVADGVLYVGSHDGNLYAIE